MTRLVIWLILGAIAGIIFIKERKKNDEVVLLTDVFTFFGLTIFGLISLLTIAINKTKFFKQTIWKK